MREASCNLHSSSAEFLCEQCLQESVANEVRKAVSEWRMVGPKDCIAVAFSGGKDSTVLLSLLVEIQSQFPETEIIAVTLDEGIAAARDRNLTVRMVSQLLGVIGNLQVHEALRIILGHPPNLANRLFVFDIDMFHFDVLSIARHERCPVCGPQASTAKPPADTSITASPLCADNTFLVHSNSPVPINIDRAATILQSRYSILAKSALGVQIQFAPKVQVSIVKEGNILVNGVSSAEEAEAIYHQVLSEIQEALIRET